MRYGLKDRIIDAIKAFNDRLNLSKESWAHIGIAAGIAILISGLIILAAVPGKGIYDDYIARLDDAISDINDTLGQGTFATDDDLVSIFGQLTDHAGNISWLNNHIGNVEDKVNSVQDDVSKIICSSPDAHLEGMAGNYTLYVKSGHAGEFTANVHLVYSPPVSAGNATNYSAAVDYFYAGINWTIANHSYTPMAAFNGTAWGTSRVSFNIGTFTLEAHTEAIIGIVFTGLEHEPAYGYVDIHQVIS